MPVRVTHPFDPLFGQAREVVAHRHNWGEDRIYFRDDRGHLTSLPVGWTSLVPQDAFVAVAAGRSRFRIQDLVDLAAWRAVGWPRWSRGSPARGAPTT
ncbi:MAG: hypothetical protein HYR50_00360 [Candidatus Rokubacteria bacterium]|nr:hypothetical protein [Candidatus Rokubacteria bacterium]